MRTLGRSGLKVSAVGLGGNTFGMTVDGDAAVALIHAALDEGMTFIDTSGNYGGGRSEELIGQALEGRRHAVVVATKVGLPVGPGPYDRGLSRRHIMQAVEASLRRLRTDYIDLYLAHLPDPETPIDETLRAMDDLVREGKVRYPGGSNYAAWQMVDALQRADRQNLHPWASVQPRWNIVDGLDDPSLLSACRAFGVGIIPYMPLASGILADKYRRGEEPAAGTRIGDVARVREELTDAKLAVVERLRPWAQARGHTTAELGIAWLLAHAEVSTVIVGARSIEQVAANLRAAEWVLTPDERDDAARVAHDG